VNLGAKISASLVGASCLFGQMLFEVASVKPSGTQFRGISEGEDGSYRALGVTLKMLIASAYGVPEFRIEGGPGWVGSDRWDIDARSGVARRLAGAAIEQPLRALLEQRFKLRATMESKEASVYFLDIGKSGVKMKPSPDPAARPMMSFGNGFIGRESLNTTLLTGFLTRYLGRTVMDRTGLTAVHKVHITWTPDVSEGDPQLGQLPLDARIEQRSIFSALEESLGLKLTSGKQESPLVTITSVERPGEN
jgi:uncharacterized protein (TIGR03435 family)